MKMYFDVIEKNLQTLLECHPKNSWDNLYFKDRQKYFFRQDKIISLLHALDNVASNSNKPTPLSSKINSSRKVRILFLSNFGWGDTLFDRTDSAHTKLLFGFAEDLKDATQAKCRLIETSESLVEKQNLSVEYIQDPRNIFLQSQVLHGSLTQKLQWLSYQVQDYSPDWIVTLGGYHECIYASSLGYLAKARTLRLQSNQNSIPYTKFTHVYDFDNRTFPISDIDQFSCIDIALRDKSADPLTIVSAVRGMEKKVPPNGDFVQKIKVICKKYPLVNWVIIGVKSHSDLYLNLSAIKGCTVVGVLEYSEYIELLRKADAMFFPTEYLDGSVYSIACAYFLGLSLFVSEDHPCWGQITQDNFTWSNNSVQALTNFLDDPSNHDKDIIRRERLQEYHRKREKILNYIYSIICGITRVVPPHTLHIPAQFKSKIKEKSHVSNLLGSTWNSKSSTFVFVGPYSSTKSRLLTYTIRENDPLQVQYPPIKDLRDVAWSDYLNLYVAISSSETESSVLLSGDAISWSKHLQINSEHQWRSIVWASGFKKFFAVSSNKKGSQIICSENGKDWNLQSTPGSGMYMKIIYSKNIEDPMLPGVLIAIACAGESQLIYSVDGISWKNSKIYPNKQWHSLAVSPELGIIVAVSQDMNETFVSTSLDGINWNMPTQLVGLGMIKDIVWIPSSCPEIDGKFLIASTNGYATSLDGDSWVVKNVKLNAHIFTLELGMLTKEAQNEKHCVPVILAAAQNEHNHNLNLLLKYDVFGSVWETVTGTS